MNDGRDPLDDSLRTSGGAFREAEARWVPDPDDVARRSRRQTTTARRMTGAAMAVLVVLLVGVGLGLTRSDDGRDEDLTVAGMGTTTEPPTTTAPTSTSVVLVPDPGADGSATTTTTTVVGLVTTTTIGSPTTRPRSTDGAATGGEDPVALPDDSTTTAPPAPTETSIPGPDPTSTTTTTAAPPVPPGVELRDDGLGIVTLGDDADEAAATLVAAFGPPRLATGWRADPAVGLVAYIIWGPSGGSDPNADQALVIRLVSTPSHDSDGLVRFTYCPTPGFPHLLLPGGVDPGPDCFTRSL